MIIDYDLQKWELNRYKYCIYDDVYDNAFLTNDVEDIRKFAKTRTLLTMIEYFPKINQYMIAFI